MILCKRNGHNGSQMRISLLLVLLFTCGLGCSLAMAETPERAEDDKNPTQVTSSRSPQASHYRQGSDEPDAFIQRLLEVAQRAPNARARRAIKKVIASPKTYHFQLLVTEVDPKTHALTPHEYRVDRDYIYPASAMKTFGSLSALMYFTQLAAQRKTSWISPKSPMRFHAKRCARKDSSNLDRGLLC